MEKSARCENAGESDVRATVELQVGVPRSSTTASRQIERTWLVNEHDMTHDGWPVAQLREEVDEGQSPRFLDRATT